MTEELKRAGEFVKQYRSAGAKLNAKQIKDQRAILTEAMQDLHSKAETEKRGLTNEERSSWEEAKNKLNDLNTILEAVETEERKAASHAGEYGTYLGGNENSKGEESTTEWRDITTGREIHVLKPEQRFIDLLKPEERNLSLGRAVRALITSDWSGAEAEQRALSTGAGSGGVMVPEVLSSRIIDLARAKSVVMSAGARSVRMDSKTLTIARLASDPTFEYKAENVAFTASDPTFGALTFSAFTLGTLVTMSRELAADASNAVSAIENAIAQALALEIDRVALLGTGTTQPTGILNAADIQEVAGAAGFTYADLLAARTKVLTANGLPNGYIISPREDGTLESLMTTDGHYLAPPRSIEALTRHISNNIPITLGTGSDSVAFLGDFKQVLFGVRQGMLIEVSNDAGDAFEKHQVKIKCTWRGDVQFEQPSQLVRIKGITAA